MFSIFHRRVKFFILQGIVFYKLCSPNQVMGGGEASQPQCLHCFLFSLLFPALTAPATDLAFSLVNGMLLLSCGLDKNFICYDVQAAK